MVACGDADGANPRGEQGDDARVSAAAGRRTGQAPLRKAINHSLPQDVPMVASSASPLVGASDVIESLIGKAKQRLEAHGRSELRKSILVLPCLCGALPHDLVAKALTTVRVQDVTPWGAEEVGETRLAVRRRALGRRQPRKPETKTAARFAKAG